MYKKILLFLIAVVFVLELSKMSFAVENSVNVGNKICPVSSEKIEEKMKSTYEYNGKVYNFCCASCIEEFKKDPDKYIKKVEEELKGVPEAKSKEHMMMPESGMMDK